MTRFIFATEDGTVVAWSSGSSGVLKVGKSSAGAVYKGLALGNSGGSNFSVRFLSGFSSPATAAHIHGPAGPGVPASVLIPLTTPPSATSAAFSGSVSLVPTNLATLLLGQTHL